MPTPFSLNSKPAGSPGAGAFNTSASKASFILTSVRPACPPGSWPKVTKPQQPRADLLGPRTFFGFLYQVLHPDCPCREIVRQIQALFALASPRRVSPATGAYCQARNALPIDLLAVCAVRRGPNRKPPNSEAVPRQSHRRHRHQPARHPGKSRTYPQSRNRNAAVVLPLMKVVGVFSLATGVLLDYAKGNKHPHELSLLHRCWINFSPATWRWRIGA